MERIQQHRITRNRELRACTECRKRKLRCDRQLPCSSCTRRNDLASCIYEGGGSGGSTQGLLQSECSRRLKAEAKLEELERMVQELFQLSAIRAGPEEMAQCVDDTGRERCKPLNISRYTGATHWSAMLENIDELRAVMDEYDDISSADSDVGSEDDSISVLFGVRKPLTLQEIISTFLPSKHETERLVAAYFRAIAIGAPFIHTSHFTRRLKSFWENPLKAPPLWTSILFSVLNISSRTLSTRIDPTTNSQNYRFARAAANCLAIGEYYRPQRFTVEALLIFAQSQCLGVVDISPDVGILFGTLSRLTTTMGYHMDDGVSIRKNISAFELEMRRRVWSLYVQLDILVSFQLGLPRTTQSSTCNVQPPTNLLDSDFDEDTEILPLARPDSEPTQVLLYITKHKLMAVFEKILQHTLSMTDRPNGELEAIEQELRATYDALPVAYQSRAMADSVCDSPSLIVTRLCTYLIYQKCICVLHRWYVTRGRHPLSVVACHSSASNIVKCILDIYLEFEPGGQLETERWFLSGITWHDFLLGCTSLCLIVGAVKYYEASLFVPASIDMKATLQLLCEAKPVCAMQATRSRDTQKVIRLIETTIMRFGSSVHGIHTGGLSTVAPVFDSHGHYETALPLQDEQQNWLHGDQMMPSEVDDITWTYMEQFLDISNQVAMANGNY